MYRFLAALSMTTVLFISNTLATNTEDPKDLGIYNVQQGVVIDRVSVPLAEFSKKYKPIFDGIHKKDRPELVKLIGELLTLYAKARDSISKKAFAHLKKSEAIPAHETIPESNLTYNFQSFTSDQTNCPVAKTQKEALEICQKGLFGEKMLSESQLHVIAYDLCLKVFNKTLENEIFDTLSSIEEPHMDFMISPLARHDPENIAVTIQVLSSACMTLWNQNFFEPTFNGTKAAFMEPVRQMKQPYCLFGIDVHDQALAKYFESRTEQNDALNLATLCSIISNIRVMFPFIREGWLEKYKADKQVQPAVTTSKKSRKKKGQEAEQQVAVEVTISKWLQPIIEPLRELCQAKGLIAKDIAQILSLITKAEKAELQPLRKNTEELQKTNQQLTSRITSLEDKLATAQRAKETLAEQAKGIAERNKTIRTLREEKAELNEELKSARAELHESKQEADRLVKETRQQAKSLTTAKAAQEKAEHQHKEYKETANNKATELQKNLTTAKKEAADNKSALAKANKAAEDSQSALATAKKATAETQSALATARQELERMKAELAAEKLNNEKLTQGNQLLFNDSVRFQHANVELLQHLNQASQDNGGLVATMKEKDADIVSLVAAKERLLQASKEKDAIIAALRAQLAEVTPAQPAQEDVSDDEDIFLPTQPDSEEE